MQPTIADMPTITDMVEAYAQDAVDWAKEAFQVDLDYSEASIEQLEMILDKTHSTMPRGILKWIFGPRDRQVRQMAKMLGCYLGETMRKLLDGKWLIADDPSTALNPVLVINGSTLWPVSRVYRRLRSGSEDNVWHYFLVLAGRREGAVAETENSDIGEIVGRAAANCDLEQLTTILDSGINPNSQSQGGMSPLHMAIGLGFMTANAHRQGDVVALLIEKGADVNSTSSEGDTPLHTAASLGNLEIVEVLIQNGADHTVKNDNGKTARDLAQEANHKDIAAKLRP
jgi:hypothetical protein